MYFKKHSPCVVAVGLAIVFLFGSISQGRDRDGGDRGGRSDGGGRSSGSDSSSSRSMSSGRSQSFSGGDSSRARSAVARHDHSAAAHRNPSVREARSRFKVHRPIDRCDHSATARAAVRSAPNHLAELRPTAAVNQAAHRTIAQRSSAPMAIKRSRDLYGAIPSGGSGNRDSGNSGRDISRLVAGQCVRRRLVESEHANVQLQRQ